MQGGLNEIRPLRWAKILFFLLSMLLSLLLVCAPPLFVAILDILLSTTLQSAATPSLPKQLVNYNDLPTVSTIRSLLILCAYVVWKGQGPYLGITTTCSLFSGGYVSVKAVMITYGRGRVAVRDEMVMEGLFLSSLLFAVAHVVVAYKTSCRVRRKMIVYRIDIEAVQHITTSPQILRLELADENKATRQELTKFLATSVIV